MADKGVWVLTSEYNEYDQHGEYLECIWASKPSIEQLAKHFKMTSDQVPVNVMAALEFLLHIQKGGGRQNYEDHWYNLSFVEFGKVYA